MIYPYIPIPFQVQWNLLSCFDLFCKETIFLWRTMLPRATWKWTLEISRLLKDKPKAAQSSIERCWFRLQVTLELTTAYLKNLQREREIFYDPLIVLHINVACEILWLVVSPATYSIWQISFETLLDTLDTPWWSCQRGWTPPAELTRSSNLPQNSHKLFQQKYIY